jgi:N-acetylneuraminic acid mutarotase
MTPLPRRRWHERQIRFAVVTACLLGLIGVSTALAVVHWRATGRLHQGRFLAGAALLPDGRVLVTGGFQHTMLASAELYDPSQGRWSVVAPFYSPRFAHTATTLSDGSVLIAGGSNLTVGYLSSAERYLPATNTWVPAGQLAIARDNDTATLLKDGRVLVVGGLNNFGPALKSAEIYNPATNSWTRAADMAASRYHHTATLLPDGRVLVVGGEQRYAGGTVKLLSGATVYDPTTNLWASAGSLPYQLANQTATLMQNGRVLVVGGGDREPGFTARVEIYNPARNRWTAVAPLPQPRAFATAALLPSGRVLVTGGINDHGALGNAELYDPTHNRWTSAGETRPGYREASVTLQNGMVLVIGGESYQGPPLNTTTLYSP